MLSPKQLKLVHVAARECGLSDEAYRAILRAEFGVDTSKGLQQKEFEKLMARFAELGFTPLRRDGTPIDDPTPPGTMTNQQRWELMRLLEALGETPDSLHFRGIMKKACGCDHIAWLTREAAGKTIDAVREVLRRGQPTHA